MIGRWATKVVEEEQEEPKGFDAFDLRLGDIMRGERATLGKSLLDVQRELRIKASYIAAIENADPGAFDTPGFIAGYVRSYARYLGMDPDEAFTTFCEESGFSVAHGMSAEASVVKKSSKEARQVAGLHADPFERPGTPFAPVGDSVLSRVEPAAVGSLMVLVALIGAIGFGGWTVLQEVQRVQVTPVDETPVVLSQLDPLEGALSAASNAAAPAGFEAPRVESFDRLYRPQALDVPVLVARDAPIATIDPQSVGNFTQPERLSPALPVIAENAAAPTVPQVVEGPKDTILMVAAFPSWVRVQATDGSIIFEATMNKGDVYEIPKTEEPPILRTGESGALYFAMADGCFGPVGERGTITSNVPLTQQALVELYDPVNPAEDGSLSRMFADLASSDIDPAILAAMPCQTN